MPKLTLAIEISNPTSGPVGVAAGDEAGALLGEEPLRPSPAGRHDDDLVPAIDRLFRRLGATPRDLGAVAVSVGPGGYTALRIAVATAKMLAEASGARTIAVPSSLSAAWNLPDLAPPCLVCLGSKGETTHATVLPHTRRDRWPADAQVIGLVDHTALAQLQVAAIVADATLPASFAREAAGLGIPILPPRFSAPAVLELSRHIPAIDALALAPFYPREAEAVTLWKKRPR